MYAIRSYYDVVGLIAGAVVFDEISVTRCNYKILDVITSYSIHYTKLYEGFQNHCWNSMSVESQNLSLMYYYNPMIT